MPVIDHPPLQLQARVGQPLVIALASFPGAGALWQAPAAPAGCTLAPAEHAPGRTPASPGVGGPGEQRFVLTCSQPGAQTLRFELKRPWEARVQAVQPVQVEVR